MKKFFATITLALVALLASAQVRVKASLDSTKILIGERTHWTITVDAPKGAQVAYAHFADTTNVPHGIEVLEQHLDTIANGNAYTWTFHRTLTAWDARNYELPAVTVQVNGKDYTTGKLAFNVIETKVDTAATAPARPSDGIQKSPFLLSEWLPYYALCLLAVLLLVAAYIINLRLKNQKPLVKRRQPERKLLPHEKAMRAIEQVKTQYSGSDNADQKVYYTALTDVLRQYLEDRFGIKAMEMTSAEIVETLRREGNSETNAELERVFATADLVKFAKYSTQDNEKNYYLGNVVDYIEETKSGYQPPQEPAISEAEQEDKRNQRMRLILRWCKYAAIATAIAFAAIAAWGISELLN